MTTPKSFFRNLLFLSTTDSISNTTGSVVISGGLAVQKNTNILGNLTVGSINFNGNLFQNGNPYIGSQWTGTSGTLYYGSGGNTFVGINTTNPTSTLTVAGDLFVSGNTTLGNFYLNNFSSGSLATNVVNIGSTSYLFAASATSGNNIITPTIVSGLVFPIATTRSFVVVVSASTLCSTNPNYFTQYTIEGIQTDSGWVINDYIVGDPAIMTFSINSSGQLLYTSTNVINWTSTTLRYQATGYFINSSSLPPNITTSGNFNVNSLTVTNTTDTNSITSGSVIINGGLGISKNINVGGGGTFGGALIPNTNVTYDLGSSTNRWRTLFLSGTTIDLGGTLISATSGTIAFGSTILTTTTTGNLASSIQNLVSTTSTIGSLNSINILATNVSYGNASGLTATIPNVVHTNISTGTLSGLSSTMGNSVFTNLTVSNNLYVTGSLIAVNVTTLNVIDNNITTGSLNATNVTSTNINTINISVGTLSATTSTIPNVVHTNISTGTLSATTATISNILATNSIINTGTSNLNFNSNTLGNLYTTGGNVGINTSSPTSALTVTGNIQNTGYSFIKSTSIVIPANTSNTNYKIASISGGIYTCKFRVQTYDSTFLSHQMLTFEISNAFGNTSNGAPSIRLQNSTYHPDIVGNIASILFCVLSDTSQDVYLVMKSSTATYTVTIYLVEDSSGTVNLLSPASGTPSGSVYTYSVQSSISTLIGNESTQLTMTHNGNVGINTSSPTNTLSISGNVNINSTTSTLLYNTTGYQKLVISGDAYGSTSDPTNYGQMIICGTTDQTKRLGFMMDTTNNIGVIQAGHAGSSVYPLSLGTGNVGINTTSPGYNLDVNGTARINGPSLLTQYVTIGATNTENCALYILANTGNTGVGDGIHMKAGPGGDGNTIIQFNNAAGTQRGYINGTSTSVNYSTSSDSRLKTNVKPIINSIEIIKKLNPVTFNWHGKENELENDFGFIAQEVHKVIPQTRNNILSSYTNCNCKGNYICNNIDHEFPIDKNNKPIYYGLDYSKFTPHLTSAIKELINRVEYLEMILINK